MYTNTKRLGFLCFFRILPGSYSNLRFLFCLVAVPLEFDRPIIRQSLLPLIPAAATSHGPSIIKKSGVSKLRKISVRSANVRDRTW